MIIMIVSCTVAPVKKNHLVTIDGQDMLVGLIEQDELFQVFQEFKLNHDVFNPQDSTIQIIKSFSKKITVQIYLGTWCGDTKEQLPVFLKIFNISNNPNIKYFLRAVDRTKIDPEKTSPAFHITRVPTLIFQHDGVEFARFVESPEFSVEEDLIRILRQCP
jgi:thiol-disulfide isomerase/thioredoxin